MSDARARNIFLRLLFPPPPAEIVNRVIFGNGWAEHFQASTRFQADPGRLAQTIAVGQLRGDTPQEIARDLMPAVDNVRSTTKRLARTETMRVAHEVQHDAHERGL